MNTELHARVADRVGRPALQLIETARVTRTFLGGAPSAATPFEWPRKDGKPLAFIGQLDLSELALDEAAPWLPKSGRLLFFHDMDEGNLEEGPWWFDPIDRGGWAVIHDAGADAPREIPFPDDLDEDLRAAGIKYLEGRPYVSIPSLDRVTLEEAGASEDEEDEYFDLNRDAFGGHPMHQIGGFPEPIQSDEMERECQVAFASVHCGDASGLQTSKVRALRRDENDWRLLFQVDSDDDLNLNWVDSGMVYYWVRERDARVGDFSNVWLVLQSY